MMFPSHVKLATLLASSWSESYLRKRMMHLTAPEL